jgi:hypothetical protein
VVTGRVTGVEGWPGGDDAETRVKGGTTVSGGEASGVVSPAIDVESKVETSEEVVERVVVGLESVEGGVTTVGVSSPAEVGEIAVVGTVVVGTNAGVSSVGTVGDVSVLAASLDVGERGTEPVLSSPFDNDPKSVLRIVFMRLWRAAVRSPADWGVSTTNFF